MGEKLYEKHVTLGSYPVQKICPPRKTASKLFRVPYRIWHLIRREKLVEELERILSILLPSQVFEVVDILHSVLRICAPIMILKS